MTKRAILYAEETEQFTDFAEFLLSAGWTIVSGGKAGELLRKEKIQFTNEPSFSDYDMNTRSAQELITHIANSVYETEYAPAADTEDNVYLVCINLFPRFLAENAASHPGGRLSQESFFISSVLRTACLNYKNVLVLTDSADYRETVIQLRTDYITDEFRYYLYGKAMNHISAFDSSVANAVLRNSPHNHSNFMNYLTFPFQKNTEFHAGANEQQESCLYGLYTLNGTVNGVKKLHGKELTYSVMNDTALAWEHVCMLYTYMKDQFSVKSLNNEGYEFVSQFTPLRGTVFTVAVKHRSVIGAAIDGSVLSAFRNTCKYDASYVKDTVIASTSVVDAPAAHEMLGKGLAAVIAPGFTTEARQILSESADIRLLLSSDVRCTAYDVQLVNGGMLIQTKDLKMFEQWHIRTKNRPSQRQIDEMAFGMLLLMNIRSHTSVLIRENSVTGISQACISSKKSVDMVLADHADYMRRNGLEPVLAEESSERRTSGEILACDAAIPFCDSVRQLIEQGLAGIIQTGGTPDDEEFIRYCDEHGVVMIFTGMTHISY